MKYITFLGAFAVIIFSTNTNSMSQAAVEAKLQEASSAYSSGKYAECVELIEEALQEVRLKAPLVIENFYPVRREAPYFGSFEPRANNIYETNEVLYFYLEPKNVVFRKNGEIYTGGFFLDLKFKHENGDVLLEQKKFFDAEFSSRNPVNDLYANITLNLTGVTPGTYKTEFTVRDQNSDKTATVEKEIIVQ